jgi:diguanylate cyclase (GGDEF)-like protein/PAS domain S-box-containing protein
MVNKSLADFLGADPDDIIGKTDYDFFPKKIADSYSSDETFILQTGESIIDKTEKNPNDILVSTSKIPYHDAKGNIIGIIGLSKNITKSVAELEYEKSLFDTLMDNINEDIYFKDRNSKIVRINKALAKRYGFDNAEEAVGMSDADFYSEEHASQAYKDEQEIIKTGKPVLDFEEKATYTDKEDRWWSSSKMPWYDRNGKIIGIFGIGKDITDKKNTEEKIKYTSFHDPLTGLYNRSFFDEEMIRLDSERQLPITVLIGDVNGLKLVNDSQGHLKGDELLKIVAQIFRDSFRKDDIISRWGGDEFIVLLPKTSTEIANKIKKRIQRLCKQHSTKNMPVSISIGICTKKNKRG